MPKRNDTATGMDEAVPFPAVLAASTMAAVDRSLPVAGSIPDSLVDLLTAEGILVARSRRTARTTAAAAVEASEVSATKFDLP